MNALDSFIMTRLFVYTRHVQTHIKIPSSLTCKQLFESVETLLGHSIEHRIFLYSDQETITVTNNEQVIELPERVCATPEQKLILWIFEHPDRPCKVWHLWQDEMMFLLQDPDMGVDFPDGVAYDKNGHVYTDQHTWTPGSIVQLYTLLPNKRPVSKNPETEYNAPSICGCDLTRNDVFTCPTAWHYLS